MDPNPRNMTDTDKRRFKLVVMNFPGRSFRISRLDMIPNNTMKQRTLLEEDIVEETKKTSTHLAWTR